jgi:hypothetical protein
MEGWTSGCGRLNEVEVSLDRAIHEAGTPAYFSAEYPVALNQPPGVQPSGLPNQPDGSMEVADDSPYSAQPVSQAPVGGPLLARSPLYQEPGPPVAEDDRQHTSFAGRLQPPVGLSGGAYALNTELDAGSPVATPDEGLPALRDGEYQFSARLKNLGDQGIMDHLLRRGGSYLNVNQAPYVSDDRPAGR